MVLDRRLSPLGVTYRQASGDFADVVKRVASLEATVADLRRRVATWEEEDGKTSPVVDARDSDHGAAAEAAAVAAEAALQRQLNATG